ncbi:MAG: hypothetical protein GIKADHBN_02352 [Phycisphaerales bacterium]|nr:hypothetical protein [Phycisphaerales bacterium]
MWIGLSRTLRTDGNARRQVAPGFVHRVGVFPRRATEVASTSVFWCSYASARQVAPGSVHRMGSSRAVPPDRFDPGVLGARARRHALVHTNSFHRVHTFSSPSGRLPSDSCSRRPTRTESPLDPRQFTESRTRTEQNPQPAWPPGHDGITVRIAEHPLSRRARVAQGRWTASRHGCGFGWLEVGATCRTRRPLVGSHGQRGWPPLCNSPLEGKSQDISFLKAER